MARRGKVKPFPHFTGAGESAINTLPVRAAPVAVDRIVGSVSKAHRLTPDFLPKEQKSRSRRFRSVQRAMSEGVLLPPIDVYGLRREYYVIDGHNRVAAAIANGVRYLDAHIHECIITEESPEDRLANLQMHFERRTGLSRIQCTRADYYPMLLKEILTYRDRLRQQDPEMSTREAARRWYKEEFVPVAEPLDLGATTMAFPGQTVSDLYLAVREHWRRLEEECGTPVPRAQALTDFQARYPRPLVARVLRPLHRHTRRAVWRVAGGPPAS